MSVRVLPIDASTFQRHPLHADDRAWVEKNCYIDVWIELVHALGCEPRAMLPVVAAIDFEGDQWTFFKPSHDDLRELYGIDVQELNCWRPLVEHALEHLGGGKLIATEADAWWLPDVSGTDYRRQHTKSTIVLNAVDPVRRRLGYFHNAGYFELEGEDFDRTFRLDAGGQPIEDPAFMPFFAELVRVDRVVRRPAGDLKAVSRGLLARHLARRPVRNPVRAFGERFAVDFPDLQQRGLPYYHAWAFATVRQLGAGAELMAECLKWLGDPRSRDAVGCFETISHGAKSFVLKAARAVNARKPIDAAPLFDAWAVAYDAAMDVLAP